MQVFSDATEIEAREFPESHSVETVAEFQAYCLPYGRGVPSGNSFYLRLVAAIRGALRDINWDLERRFMSCSH